MISAGTFHDLHRYAEPGVFRTRIAEFSVDNSTPEAGEEVTLRWNFAKGASDLGTLHVYGQPRKLVAPVGIHRVRVGAVPVRINLRVGAASADLLVVPLRCPMVPILDEDGDVPRGAC